MVLDRVHTVDLATGGNVALMTSETGSPADEAKWAVRCDCLARLRHHTLAELIDYGPLGETRRFEAWRCTGPWTGSTSKAERAVRFSTSFLAACGLTASIDTHRVYGWRGRPVWIPDQESGYEHTGQREEAALRDDLEGYGLDLVPRQAIDIVTRFLAEADSSRPLAIALRAEPEGGVTTAIGTLARAGRLNGYVPLCIGCARRSVLRYLHGRSLLLIGTESAVSAWRVLVNCTVRSPRPHRLLMATTTRAEGMYPVQLENIATDVLIRAVRPAIVHTRMKDQISRAARQSYGRPARFARLLWGYQAGRHHPVTPSRAAERASSYVAQSMDTPSPRQCPLRSPDVVQQRERMQKAVYMLEAGRQIAGERVLRQAIGGLARRHDWCEAARGALILSEFLLKRGRPGPAQGSLQNAQEYAARVSHQNPTLDLGIVRGRIAMDLGRIDEAEGVLRTVAGAARAGRDRARDTTACIELARCLFWRGRYREADDIASAIGLDDIPADVTVRVMTLTSRLAVGRQDLNMAISRALEAVEKVKEANSACAAAHAWYGAAFAHFSVGDTVAVRQDVEAVVLAARRAHDPLTALRARLLIAESDRRHGETATAVNLLTRIGRLRASVLPHTIRARCALLSALIAPRGSTQARVARVISATGLPALALYAPHDISPQDATLRDSVNDVLGILKVTHAPDDGGTLLTRLAVTVRERLGATSVAIFSTAGADCQVLGRDGGRPGALGESIARRVVAAGQLIDPHIHAEGFEGGAPVRYGGDTLGALVARWPTGVSLDRPRVTLVLTTAATAAGPGVAEMLADRSQPTTAGELVGVSAAMTEIRKSVERAAASPFSVLVVGESGSGKELVARALHRLSPRRTRPFYTINCAALPDDLVESELFGHARGAFSGAVSDRAGVFEEAHTGTLFLDEIGELSPRAQAKILRTIQEGELRRIGENVARRIDVRLVSATNRDLASEATRGCFRMDLLYRLDIVRIVVPPLRNRRDDIALLIDRYWREAILRVGSRATLARATIRALSAYAWPGNVRELQNVLAALAVRCPKRGVVLPDALPPQFAPTSQVEGLRLCDARRTFEERFVRAALARTGGHRTLAAAELGVSRQGLAKLIARLGIGSARATS